MLSFGISNKSGRSKHDVWMKDISHCAIAEIDNRWHIYYHYRHMDRTGIVKASKRNSISNRWCWCQHVYIVVATAVSQVMTDTLEVLNPTAILASHLSVYAFIICCLNAVFYPLDFLHLCHFNKQTVILPTTLNAVFHKVTCMYFITTLPFYSRKPFFMKSVYALHCICCPQLLELATTHIQSI